MPDSSQSSDERDVSSDDMVQHQAAQSRATAGQPDIPTAASHPASSSAPEPNLPTTVDAQAPRVAPRNPAYVPIQVGRGAEVETDNANNIFVSGDVLESDQFPSNAPQPHHAQGGLVAVPSMLTSESQLESILHGLRQQYSLSNFEDVSEPANSARSPHLPTMNRFSSTLFANTEHGDRRVIKSTRTNTGAIYDLSFPVRLSVTDKQGISLPGLPIEGIADSQGYPLLYNFEDEKNLIRARSSGALYPVNLSRGLNHRISTYPDTHMLKTWSHMFQLTNDKDAQDILQQRVMGATAGDNHIALLLKAYLAYFDSIAATLDGMECTRNTPSYKGVVLDVRTQDPWATQVLGSSAEIVNVLGGNNGYQEFWAYCCFSSAPIYASKTTELGEITTTPFSLYELSASLDMICLCDTEAYSVSRTPAFFGKPDIILGHIESYVQRYGLQEQANEAVQIAMLWPTLVMTGAHVSLPKPLHNVDWLGSEVEKPLAETSHSKLVGARHFGAFASTLAGAWSMQSQAYDLVALITSNRGSWQLTPKQVESAVSWLTAKVSAPGIGWGFLLGQQFSVTQSLLYLTGLAVEVVDWQKFFNRFTWQESQFPAHIRLLQPYWVQWSVCCVLPWVSAWTPDIQIVADQLTAAPSEIMRLLRLGILDSTTEGLERATMSSGIFPILQRNSPMTITINTHSIALLRTVLHDGIKVTAIPARPSAPKPLATFIADDPDDTTDVLNAWELAGGAKASDTKKGKARLTSSRRSIVTDRG